MTPEKGIFIQSHFAQRIEVVFLILRDLLFTELFVSKTFLVFIGEYPHAERQLMPLTAFEYCHRLAGNRIRIIDQHQTVFRHLFYRCKVAVNDIEQLFAFKFSRECRFRPGFGQRTGTGKHDPVDIDTIFIT